MVLLPQMSDQSSAIDSTCHVYTWRGHDRGAEINGNHLSGTSASSASGGEPERAEKVEEEEEKRQHGEASPWLEGEGQRNH